MACVITEGGKEGMGTKCVWRQRGREGGRSKQEGTRESGRVGKVTQGNGGGESKGGKERQRERMGKASKPANQPDMHTERKKKKILVIEVKKS